VGVEVKHRLAQSAGSDGDAVLVGLVAESSFNLVAAGRQVSQQEGAVHHGVQHLRRSAVAFVR
jgi:hypothetical protein